MQWRSNKAEKAEQGSKNGHSTDIFISIRTGRYKYGLMI